MHVARGWASRTGLVLAWLGLMAACRSPRADGVNPRVPEAEAIAIDEILYRLEGGIAGFDLELRLLGGGSLVVVEAGRSVRRGQLAGAEWQEVVRLAGAARLAELEPRYGSPGAVVDAWHEVVTVKSGTRTITVDVTGDPGDEPPERFRDLANRLREIALTTPEE